ncbi:class F sortase [Streptomyces sp. NPDC001941]|uniref:class F sortase n=1 Tax=Streptomyces sp. NPDC001941 TaxID=3154659 RepID=UPI003328664D
MPDRHQDETGTVPWFTRRWVPLTCVALLLAVGGTLLGLGFTRERSDPGRLPPTAVRQTAVPLPPDGHSHAPEPSGRTDGGTPAPARPERLSIPSLGVSTPLEKLGLDERGAMRTPRDPASAGWYERGPVPGVRGPAVIAGHVTWNGARAVFFELARVRVGARVDVRRADGVTATFTVTRVAQYPKDRFPSLEVYRDTSGPELRLITCAGDYSGADHRYSDNIVVYARVAPTS